MYNGLTYGSASEMEVSGNPPVATGWDSSGISVGYWWDTGGMLVGYWWGPGEILVGYCWDTGGMLVDMVGYWWDNGGILVRYCWDTGNILVGSGKVGHYINIHIYTPIYSRRSNVDGYPDVRQCAINVCIWDRHHRTKVYPGTL